MRRMCAKTIGAERESRKPQVGVEMWRGEWGLKAREGHGKWRWTSGEESRLRGLSKPSSILACSLSLGSDVNSCHARPSSPIPHPRASPHPPKRISLRDASLAPSESPCSLSPSSQPLQISLHMVPKHVVSPIPIPGRHLWSSSVNSQPNLWLSIEALTATRQGAGEPRLRHPHRPSDHNVRCARHT